MWNGGADLETQITGEAAILPSPLRCVRESDRQRAATSANRRRPFPACRTAKAATSCRKGRNKRRGRSGRLTQGPPLRSRTILATPLRPIEKRASMDPAENRRRAGREAGRRKVQIAG